MRKTTLLITTGVVATSLVGGAAAFASTGATPVPTSTVTPVPVPAPTSPSTTGNSGTSIQNADLDAAIAAALGEVGPGTVVDADLDDDASHAYEIDILLEAGGLVEVKLTADLTVVSVEHDDRDGDRDDDADRDDDGRDSDEVTDQSVRDAASAAALAATGGGTVVSVESSDDADHPWEVEVDLGDGEHADVELDADFQVVELD